MGSAFVAVLTDKTSEVEVAWLECESHFLVGLAAGAGVGRLATIDVHLAAGRTPFAEVGLLRALEQQ